MATSYGGVIKIIFGLSSTAGPYFMSLFTNLKVENTPNNRVSLFNFEIGKFLAR